MRGRGSEHLSRLPPVAALAGAFATGVALALLGAPSLPAPLLFALLLLPVPLWRRPAGGSGRTASRRRARTALVLLGCAVAGQLHAGAWQRGRARDCRLGLADGEPLSFSGPVRGGGGRGRVLVDVVAGVPRCSSTLRVRLPRGMEAPGAGSRVAVEGRWLPWSGVAAGDPERAGEVAARIVEPVTGDQAHAAGAAGAMAGGGTPLGRAGRALARWRGGLEARVERLFPRRAALVAALVLARRDGLDEDVRDAFARTGVAHLLAISGFHVGVVAGLVILLLRAAGLGRVGAAAGGAACVWVYVLLIGAPDAAVRAATILSLAAAGRWRGRPALPAGALATAFLALLLVDPGALARPGFQLSFAGAAALALVAPPLVTAWRDAAGRGGRWWGRPTLSAPAVAAVAATLVTAPVAAWHFGRVSLVGVPVTLAATPLVAAAIPGILGAVALDAAGAPGAGFLGGAVELLLTLLVEGVRGASTLSFASAWVGRADLAAGGVGAVATLALLAGARGLGGVVRGSLAAAGVAVALLLRPVALERIPRDDLEIRMLDVGQGDAILLGTPSGRWVLVDTGPGGAPGPRGVRRPGVLEGALRARGVGRIDLVVLTHPDLDHIGEAAGVLRTLPVGAVVGPGRVRETEAWGEALAAAAEGAVPWVEARRGDAVELDDVELRVLHPEADPTAGEDPNDASVVLLVRWGGFRALLTGDAPAEVEEGLAEAAGDVDLLKVAHHGSRTSTSVRFLDAVRPEIALVSAGRRNRYGHPHDDVLARLEERGARVLRTDRDGSVVVRIDREGRIRVDRRSN